MGKKTISPGGNVSGAIELPGDKSISHRYAIIAALAKGTSEIANFSTARDCCSTLQCLERLGVPVVSGRGPVRIAGRSLQGLQEPKRALDAENSGTTMRLLMGVLAGQPFDSSLTGDESLRRRPMRRVMEPLRQMGADIRSEDGDRAPVQVHGGNLHGIDYALPHPSAQVKSAVMLAGLYAEDATTIREGVRTRDHTELALREFGAKLETNNGMVRVHPRPELQARQLTVPGDLSTAVFFISAALVLPGSSIVLHNVGLNPTRTRVLDFLISIGASIHLAAVQMRDSELVGDIAVKHSRLTGGTISGAMVAEMIDELPMLACLGPFTENGIEIRDAQELRVKESDRIATLAAGLKEMGARLEELPDALRVAGGVAGELCGGTVNPYGDHRIAMALAIAALGAKGKTTIRDAECVAVSYPAFFESLKRLRGSRS